MVMVARPAIFLSARLWLSVRPFDTPLYVTTETRAVVIGGGVVGCSVAYHLARLGWTDVTLLEQHDLTDGTTWHSAGFVTSLRGVPAHRKLVAYLPALARVLRAETGRDPGWRPSGGLRLATTSTGVDELRRQAHAAEDQGVLMELRTASSAAPLAPWLDLADVQAAGWLPGDGFVRPRDSVTAYAAGAEALGATIRTGVRVTGFVKSGKRVTGVKTDDGDISCEVVVLAAGAASSTVGHQAGAAIPVVPINHQYAVTESCQPALDPDTTPTVRDPENNLYLRAAGGGLILGGYSTDPQPAWPANGAAPLAQARALAAPWDTDGVLEAAAARVVDLPPVAKVICGPEGFTPDGEPVVGATEVPGLWVAAGMGLHGMALAAGVGKTLAEQVTAGAAEWDVQALSPLRFGPFAHNRHWITTRAVDAFRRTFS
jgi:4-methylaminobutanoate oxidase (formaldehyde-forming)